MRKPQWKVNVVWDRQNEFAGLATELFQTALEIGIPGLRDRLGELSFKAKTGIGGLQAADLLASQCKDVLVEQVTKLDERKLRDTFKARVGGNVSVRYMDQKLLKDLIRANVLKGGKPSIYSTQQLSLKELLIGKNGKKK